MGMSVASSVNHAGRLNVLSSKWRERTAILCDTALFECYILSAYLTLMKTLRQQTKAIMGDLNRFVNAQTFTIIDGKPVPSPPKDEPRPQYALDNEAAAASRRRSSGR